MRAAELLQKVLERKAEGEMPVPSYDNMHTPDNHVGKKNMKKVANPEKGLDTKRDEHPTAEVGQPGEESRSMEGPGTTPKKMSEGQLNELDLRQNALVASLKLRYDSANERLLVNHPGGAARGKSFYLQIPRFKLERALQNPSYLSSPLQFYTDALRQSQSGPSQQMDVGEQAGMGAGVPPVGNGGRRRHAYIQAAQEMIDDDEDIIYDVAVSHGQKVGNVKGMRWFLDAVADWLEEEQYPVAMEAAGEPANPSVAKMTPSHSASVRTKQKDEPTNKGEPGMVKKKEKRSMDANPAPVKDFKGGSNEHKSMKKMHEGIKDLEDFLGTDLQLKTDLDSKKKLSEANDDPNAVLRQYMVTALWSSNDDKGDPLDDNFGIEDIAPETANKMKQDVERFLKMARPLLVQGEKQGYPMDRAGHDFWLTRNGHGTGFWDQNTLERGDLGDKLSDIAQQFGEASLYIGDDGNIYQFSG